MLLRTVCVAGILGLASMFLSGCASAVYGTPIEKTKVDSIQKGTTTQEQVETMFGSSDAKQMLEDGRREVDYIYTKSDSKPEWDAWIPIWDLFSMHEDVTTYQQRLQIYLKSNVVQDYEYSEKNSTIVAHSGILGGGESTTKPSGS